VIPLADSQAPRPYRREAAKPDTIQTPEEKAKSFSRWRLRDRLVAMCVVETTAAAQSGIDSWKTKPCRLLLRLLTKRSGP